MAWKIARLSVCGVKGILDKSGDFDLRTGRSIAVYAPNACGKSGYADAIKYLFSKDGAVEHLGQGDADSEHGGKHALPHILAYDHKISPCVTVTLQQDTPPGTITVSREVKTGRIDPIPVELGEIVHAAPAHRILRQHDLRRFVVDLGPREKYSELSRWLGQEYLESVLSHLTTAGNELAKADPDREFQERLQDIITHTDSEVTGYDVAATLAWCQTTANKHLTDKCSITTPLDLDNCIEILRSHRNQLAAKAGTTSVKHQAKQILERSGPNFNADNGPMSNCKNVLESSVAAEAKLTGLIATAKESVFQEIWEAASKIIDNEIPKCPLCQTEWSDTEAGSQQEAAIYVRQSLNGLTEVKAAQSVCDSVTIELSSKIQALKSALEEVQKAAERLGLDVIAKKIGRAHV